MTETIETPSPWDFASDKDSLIGVIEALALASPTPLTSDVIIEVLAQSQIMLEPALVKEATEELLRRYSDNAADSCGMELVQVAGGIAFRTRARYGQFVKALFKEKPQKLSASQLEVLSIVAYRQPITKGEIEDIRGVDCSGSMRKLLNVKLIKILGKSHGLGRPLLYGSTKEFLEFFGLNSLHDLPTLREYEDLNKANGTGENELELSAESLEVMDLFDGHEMARENYDERERLSREALESLDKALHNVASAAEKLQEQDSNL